MCDIFFIRLVCKEAFFFFFFFYDILIYEFCLTQILFIGHKNLISRRPVVVHIMDDDATLMTILYKDILRHFNPVIHFLCL